MNRAWQRSASLGLLLRSMEVAVRRTTIAARGMRFDALTDGPADGELVILLHGFPQTGSCWQDALNGLAGAGYRAVAPSQRGYSRGARPEGVEAYRVSELCDDVLAMAATLGRDRFHLVGHDWGGSVAWALAGDHPEAVASLTAVSTPHTAALRQALRGTQQRLRMAYIPVLRLPAHSRVADRCSGRRRGRVRADRNGSQPGARAS